MVILQKITNNYNEHFQNNMQDTFEKGQNKKTIRCHWNIIQKYNFHLEVLHFC